VTDEILAQFADRLKQIRERRGLTLEAAAALVDNQISAVSISRIEKRQRIPNLTSLIQLARAYDIDVLILRDGTLDVRGSGIKQIDPDPLATGGAS
jgi:transcriptional regulator with XRE-family HTH domain